MNAFRKHRTSGFTLLEILIAMSIFLAGVAALVVLFPVGLRSVRNVINDTQGGLGATEAVSTLKTLGAPETIYYTWSTWEPTTGGTINIPPWRYPQLSDWIDGTTVTRKPGDNFPVTDGMGQATQYAWEALLYPLGYDVNAAGNVVGLGPYAQQGMYNCQVAVYRNFEGTSNIAPDTVMTDYVRVWHPEFAYGRVDVTRGDDFLRLSLVASGSDPIADIVLPDGTTLDENTEDMLSYYLRPGRYIRVDTQYCVDGGGNRHFRPGLWMRITRFLRDPNDTTNGATYRYHIYVDRAFYPVGVTDQTGPTYSNYFFELSVPECEVVNIFETVITASGAR